MELSESKEVLKEKNRIRAMFFDYAFQFRLLSHLSSTSWDHYIKKTEVIESIESEKPAGYDCDAFVRFEHRGFDVFLSPMVDCSRTISESLYRERSEGRLIHEESDREGVYFIIDQIKYRRYGDYYSVAYEWVKSDFLIDIVVELDEGFTDKLRQVKERKGMRSCRKIVIAKRVNIDSIPTEVVKQMFACDGIGLILMDDIPPIDIPDYWTE